MSASDTITQLTTRGPRLAKLVDRHGRITGYDRARIFDAVERPLADLDDLHALLLRVLPQARTCVIRGSVIAGPERRGIRRLLHIDPKTGELPTLLDVPRQWLATDVDTVARPDGIPVADIAGQAGEVIRRLPDGFSGAACIAQATGGAGFKPGIRLRLWHWLSRPTTGAELKLWFRDAPVDRAIFSAAQCIYTAAPVLADGVVDPVPERIIRLPGTAVVQVPSPAALAPPPPPRMVSSATAQTAADRIERIIERQIHRVSCAPDGSKHPTLRAAARTIGGVIAQTNLSESSVIQKLVSAAKQAGAECLDTAEDTAAWGIANGRQRPLHVGGTDAGR